MKENNGRTGDKPEKATITPQLNLVVPTGQCCPMPWFNRSDLALTPEFRADIKKHGVRQNLLVRPTDRFTVEPGNKSTEKGKADCWCVIDRKGAKGPTIVADYSTKETALDHCPQFEIVAGMRRWTAAEAEGVAMVPVRVEPLTDAEARQARLTENLQRQDLTAFDEGRQFQDALSSGDYGTGAPAIDGLAKAVGKSRSHIYSRLRLTRLTQPVVDAVLAGTIEQSAAELVATIPTDAGQKEALKLIAKGTPAWDPETRRHTTEQMSVREVKDLIAERFRRTLKDASFDPKATYIVPISGRYKPGTAMRPCESCEACPKRTGNFPDLPSGSRPDVCTDPACFDAKADADWRERSTAFQKEGRPVFEGEQWNKATLDGWVRTTHHAYWDPKARTYAQLARLAGMPTGIARDTDDDVFEVTDGKAITAKLKPKSESRGSQSSATDREREKKKKLRVALAAELAPKILEGLSALEGAKQKVNAARNLAEAVFDHTGIEAHAFFAKRRNLSPSQTNAREAIAKWMAAPERTAQEYAQAAWELLLCANHGVSTWQLDWSKRYVATCDLVGIDLKAEEKRVTASSVEKLKERTQTSKPAAKGKPETKRTTKAKK